MNEEIADFFILAVDVVLVATVISSLVTLIVVQQSMADAVASTHLASLRMQEYKEYNAFNHKHVYSADIVSIVMRTKGSPESHVSTTGGTYVFTHNSNSLPYKAAGLSEKIDPNKIYDSDIGYADPATRTGVERIVFKVCGSNGACGR